MTRYRAAWVGEAVLTGPEHALLDDAGLLREALAEAARNGLDVATEDVEVGVYSDPVEVYPYRYDATDRVVRDAGGRVVAAISPGEAAVPRTAEDGSGDTVDPYDDLGNVTADALTARWRRDVASTLGK
jgi:hypothetical protein